MGGIHAAGGGSLRDRLLSFGGTAAAPVDAPLGSVGAAPSGGLAGASPSGFAQPSQAFSRLRNGESPEGSANGAAGGSGLPPGWQSRNPTSSFGAGRSAGATADASSGQSPSSDGGLGRLPP